MGVRTGYVHDQRYPVGIGQDVDLRSLLAAIDRTGSGQGASLFARTLAASRIAADQSSSPELPSRSRSCRCSASNTPARTHAVKRRCAVGTVTPNEGGRCRHAHPLVSMNTIAVTPLDRRPTRCLRGRRPGRERGNQRCGDLPQRIRDQSHRQFVNHGSHHAQQVSSAT